MIDETTKLSTWEALVYELLGGKDIACALWRHHHERESVRAIAESMQLAESSLRTQMSRARIAMRRVGIMPFQWEEKQNITQCV